MKSTQLETDYLIIGSGAVGMAFADVLLKETNATITLVDKHHKPGGHWNDAYSFVTLHQPSAFYGVSSVELSSGRRDKVGLNQGLHELASGAQVMAYFDRVMKHVFLPSGRVQYFPMCEYTGQNNDGDSEFSALIGKQKYTIKVNRKVIDGTYFKTSVPATHTPNFTIDDGVAFAPLNDLPNVNSPHDDYVVIGGGKTGIDACLWLLENQINPDQIKWIMPRDGWWIDRQNTQPSADFFHHSIGTQAEQIEAISQAESISDLFDRLEKAGALLRLDPKVKPEMFHGATISQQEVTQLRRIKNVIRHGRVTRLCKDKIEFGDVNIPSTPDTLYIDCSARAVPVTETYPVFAGNTVTVQTVRSYQPVFSAAFIAHIEANYTDQESKNELCAVVPLPNHDIDWLTGMAAQMKNQFRWSAEPGLRDWLINNRLDGFTVLTQINEDTPPDHLQVLARVKAAMPSAIENMKKLLEELQCNPDYAKKRRAPR